MTANNTTFKSVSLIEHPCVKNSTQQYEGTYLEMISHKFREIKEHSRLPVKSDHDEFWNSIENQFYNLTKDMQEKYYNQGFLSELSDIQFSAMLNIFKRHTMLHEAKSDNMDDCLSGNDYD